MSLIPTKRQRNGWLAFGTILFLLLFLVLLEFSYEALNTFFASVSFVPWQIDIYFWRKILAIPVGLILISLCIMWGYRNKIHKGLRQALKRWYLTKKLRKAIYYAKYEITEKQYNSTYALLPEIKIKFNDKDMTSGEVWIRSSTRDNTRLSKIDITPDLKGYKVEQSYISQDGDWYIYYIYSVKSQLHPEFDTLESFVEWANEGTDKYQLQIDN